MFKQYADQTLGSLYDKADELGVDFDGIIAKMSEYGMDASQMQEMTLGELGEQIEMLGINLDDAMRFAANNGMADMAGKMERMEAAFAEYADVTLEDISRQGVDMGIDMGVIINKMAEYGMEENELGQMTLGELGQRIEEMGIDL